ncbi:MAG: glycolate oxidase subunit GlcF, partial [Pseudomonadota bacterium]
AIKAQTHLAFHPPCTLQHGLQIRGVMESLLSQWGYAWTAIPDAHLCCGAAGSYTILQPAMARQLRDKKLGSIARTDAARLLSANIGCLHHLQTASQIPVHHWITWLAGQIQYAERLKSDGQ